MVKRNYEQAFAKTNKTDAILVVGEKKLHVNKALLSVHSAHFKTLFNSDSKEEIEIKDVNFEDFATLLSFVQLNPMKPTESNAELVLELADRFELPAAKRHVELFFMGTTMMDSRKIEIGEKFKLSDLLEQALKNLENMKLQDFKNFRRSVQFKRLSDETKFKVLNILIDRIDN